MKALRQARRTSEDFMTFARSLLEFRERELRESEAPIAAETDEAVKIMTIHAAKGLEFPLVAVADLAAGNIKAGADAKQVYLRIVAGIPGGFGGSNIMLKFDRIPVEDQWALVHYMMEEIMPEQE